VARHAGPSASAGTIGSQANVFIAFKGHVCTAIAYWVQGDTLHYITAQGSHNQVSLVLVDRTTSAKLNSGRLVKLVLPPP
jgi:endonuclease YncB( thermonuclease family)